MANVDELCQFARLGQTFKIQKYLQTHSVDINALNLYGESALSMATYYNQISTIEYLLANKANPKLRLSAGHTTIHIACRLANVSILHLLLSIKNNEEEEHQQQQKDKHIYDCLRIKDYANLTPIHWAATQESVSKRQKVFAYLDQRMPGVLDSRYDINWFNSWAKTHPWVIEVKLTKNILPISPKKILPKLINTDKVNRQNSEQGSSLPLLNGYTPVDMISRTSFHDYESTPRTPPTAAAAATIVYDNDIDEQKKRISSKVHLIEHASQTPKLPLTPITSRIVAFTHHYISKHEHHTNECHKSSSKQSSSYNNMSPNSQKTRYFQRFSSIIKNSLSPLSDRSTYHAEKAHVIPTLNFPYSTTSIENKRYDYEDISSPISSKRPSHNLLSNILPSTTSLSSSSDQSSRQLIKPFNFDTSCNLQHHHNRTTIETYTQNNESDNEDNDYLCKSTSTLDISSSDAYTYDV
ncbi:unnamed protein product [Rotaria sordida]|uniref:Uncharacterized protein n=1 Tax=Rotaria sordida TaxID=392033 RepID=A0A818FCP1_9BILA|nr:unnamed protein product [Rotaria sordida]CAF3473103.1 unnamed protein product [Rotaria sordida]